MATWIAWVIFIAEIIIEIITNIPKLGYEAARSMAFGIVADRHGLDVGELESHCGSAVDDHFKL